MLMQSRMDGLENIRRCYYHGHLFLNHECDLIFDLYS